MSKPEYNTCSISIKSYCKSYLSTFGKESGKENQTDIQLKHINEVRKIVVGIESIENLILSGFLSPETDQSLIHETQELCRRFNEPCVTHGELCDILEKVSETISETLARFEQVETMILRFELVRAIDLFLTERFSITRDELPELLTGTLVKLDFNGGQLVSIRSTSDEDRQKMAAEFLRYGKD